MRILADEIKIKYQNNKINKIQNVLSTMIKRIGGI
jgi:hypothetical protein